jgi:endo-1,4-beta-xylanase
VHSSPPELSQTPPITIQTDIPSLCQTLSGDFPVGAAIWSGAITGAHAELLKKHFNSITAENDMKWEQLEPEEGKFTFGVADSLVGFAKANHMRIRGHTLVWHEQNPGWLFKDRIGRALEPTPKNKKLLLRRLERHVRAVVSHFGDDVYAWDVVNEVIDPSQPDGFRHSPWFLITGTDYIDTAFRAAHKAAPNAKLYINDYSTTDPRKRELLLELVRKLKKRRVPVYGIGHQMHTAIHGPSADSIAQTIRMFTAAGMDNQITELDVSVYDDASQRYSSASEQLLVQQAYRYKELFDVFRWLNSEISSVTFWGLADDRTWLTHYPVVRPNWPLLFDARLQAKPAFWGIVDPQRLPPEILPESR